MVLNVDTINFCHRPVGETVIWSDVQVMSTGGGPLTLSKIAVRGDANCAFRVFYPETSASGKLNTRIAPDEQAGHFAPIVIASGEAIVLRVAYTPSSDGVTDRADLVMTSNAVNISDVDQKSVTSVIPMCGMGDDDASNPSDLDAGAGDVDGGDVLDAGLACDSCGKALKKGTPGCESGYDDDF